MTRNIIDRCIGKYCKIVTKEPSEEKAHTVTGIVNDIDHDAEFIIIESKEGTVLLSIKTIMVIRPKELV